MSLFFCQNCCSCYAQNLFSAQQPRLLSCYRNVMKGPLGYISFFTCFSVKLCATCVKSQLSCGLMQTRAVWWKATIFWSRLQRAFRTKTHFFHDGESSWWIKISIAIAKSNSNDMGPSPWTQKPALKNVIFASHGVGNGNLCPLYRRLEQHKEEKYILLLKAYFTTIKGDAAKTRLLLTIIDLHCKRTGLLNGYM